MWKERRTWQEVMDQVRAVRGVVNPNVGFSFQVSQICHSHLLFAAISERGQVVCMFGSVTWTEEGAIFLRLPLAEMPP